MGADLVEDAELRTRSVADARPLSPGAVGFLDGIEQWRVVGYGGVTPIVRGYVAAAVRRRGPDRRLCTTSERSEEHTSELQSRFDLVCRLLLEKKKIIQYRMRYCIGK